MKYIYSYRIYNRDTKELYEEGLTPGFPSRIHANNWVHATSLKYRNAAIGMTAHSTVDEWKMKAVRQSKKMTQQKLADKVNVPVRTIQKYEALELDPANMTLSLAIRIAKALDVSPEDLI